jgi:hypothetical protein
MRHATGQGGREQQVLSCTNTMITLTRERSTNEPLVLTGKDIEEFEVGVSRLCFLSWLLLART